MSNWKKFKLGDLLTLEYGKALKGYQYHLDGIPVYGTNGPIGFTNKPLCSIAGIIIGRKGAYRGVHYSPNPFFVIDTAFYVKLKVDYVDIRYLYGFLLCQDIDAMDSGSAIPSTDRYEIYELDILLPSLPEQRAIATVLSSLDDKIDLLHRQNKTLEAIAAMLRRQWFIGDREITMIKLGDVIEIYDSKRIPLSSQEREKMKLGQLYPYYGAAAVLDYINDYIFNGEYLLFGEDGTVQTDEGFPVLQLALGKYWVNNHTHVINAKKPFSNFLLYTILKETAISHIITGAVQPKINQENMKSLEIFVPDEKEICKTSSEMNILWERIQLNNKQMFTLENLRDTLLPKLMSGEVRVEV